MLEGRGWCGSPDYAGWKTRGMAQRYMHVGDPRQLARECDADPFCNSFTFIGYEESKSILYTTSWCEILCGSKQWIQEPFMINHADSLPHLGDRAKCFRYNPFKCNKIFINLF